MVRWRMLAIATALLSCLAAGCKSTAKKPVSRDPLTMSLLTQGAGDPLFASNDDDPPDFAPTLRAASTSRKPEPFRPEPEHNPVAAGRNAGSYDAAQRRGCAADHSWLLGQLVRHPGRDRGWRIRYANAYDGDQHRGELRLVDSPRLGLFREGDTVLVEGRPVDDGAGGTLYKFDSIVLRD